MGNVRLVVNLDITETHVQCSVVRIVTVMCVTLPQGHVVAHALVVNMAIIATWIVQYIVLLKYARKMAELVHLCVKKDITVIIVIYLVLHPVHRMNAAKLTGRVPEIVQAENMVPDVN